MAWRGGGSRRGNACLKLILPRARRFVQRLTLVAAGCNSTIMDTQDSNAADSFIHYTTFKHKRDNKPRHHSATWGDLSEILTTHVERESKDGPLWSPVSYREGATRCSAGVEALYALVLDFDDGTAPELLTPAWEHLAYVIHSSHSSTPEHPKWRAVFPLQEPVPAPLWPSVYASLAEELAHGHCDPSCKDASRIYYLPSNPPRTVPFAAIHAGTWRGIPSAARTELPRQVQLEALAARVRPVEAPRGVAPVAGEPAELDPGVAAKAEAYLESCPPAISGQNGHAALFEVACRLIRGWSIPPEHALALLREHYNPRCQPPWAPRELEHKVSEAANRSIREPGYLLPRADADIRPAIDVPPPSRCADALEGLWRPVGPACLESDPPPVSWLLRRPDDREGTAGFVPMGKVALLAAEGGCGKTSALLALGIAVVTGKTWLGAFDVVTTGKVLLLLGEEDDDEVHRRVHRVASAMGLDAAERARVAENLYVIPLAGHVLPLAGRAGATPELDAILDRLRGSASGTSDVDRDAGWALVGVDPLSRLADGDVEVDNGTATRCIQGLETFCTAPGGPAVVVAVHSSKQARRAGASDVRGVSGLTDAARLVMTMTRRPDDVEITVTKTNCTIPGPPVSLVWTGGVLTARTAAAAGAARAAAQDFSLDCDVDLVVNTLARLGTLGSIDSIATAAHLRLQRGRTAVHLAIARGLIVRSGTTKSPLFSVAAVATAESQDCHPPQTGSPSRQGGSAPPHTPPPSGTSIARPDGGGGTIMGRSRDVGTSTPKTAVASEESTSGLRDAETGSPPFDQRPKGRSTSQSTGRRETRMVDAFPNSAGAAPERPWTSVVPATQTGRWSCGRCAGGHAVGASCPKEVTT